jgi:hypothetical protein
MTRDARLLLIERIVPEHGGPAYAKLLDLMMLVIGGRERTNSEYRDLLGSAGLSLERVIPTVSGLSVLEAVPVDAAWNSRYTPEDVRFCEGFRMTAPCETLPRARRRSSESLQGGQQLFRPNAEAAR